MDTSSEERVRAANCEKHGAYEAHRWVKDRWSACPACVQADHELREAECRAAQRAEFIATATRESGLRGHFCHATFANFTATTNEQRKVLATSQEFTAAIKRGTWATLTMIGRPGTGKTHLAAAMVLETIERGNWASYTTFRDLIRTLRSTWRRDADKTEEDVINGFASVPLLVVDEIGVGFGTEAEVAQLFDVIDRRYQLGNPLVLLSNLPMPELRAALGDRLYDRIREAGQVVPMNWTSHRGAA